MRILGLILGILGGLLAGCLGWKWLDDANHMKAMIDVARSAGVSMAELDKTVMAGRMLIGSMAAGIVGGILAMMGKGKIANPNVTFLAKDKDWVAVSNGQLGGTWAYLTGRLKIRGDQALARKLGEMFP